MQNILTKIKKHDSFLKGLAILYIWKKNSKNIKMNTNSIFLQQC